MEYHPDTEINEEINITDTERLNALNFLAETKWVCRWSATERGLRVHESKSLGKYNDIREAIDAFICEVDHAGS